MTKQATLVALYGTKDARFAQFILDCQAAVASALGDAFEPYTLEQVHATIVGLERRQGTRNQNRNFWQHQARSLEMDLDGYIDFLQNTTLLPFDVQFGAYEERDYPFTSDPFQRGLETRPYDRSFVVWHDKVVVMGWPVVEDAHGQERHRYPLTLERIRRIAQQYGLLHGYHRTEEAVDNDLYMRIGLIGPPAVATASFLHDIRRTLSEWPPLTLSITINDLSIARYQDDRLPTETTVAIPVTKYAATA